MNNYYIKYLKYKSKYLELRKKIKGGSKKLPTCIGNTCSVSIYEDKVSDFYDWSSEKKKSLGNSEDILPSELRQKMLNSYLKQPTIETNSFGQDRPPDINCYEMIKKLEGKKFSRFKSKNEKIINGKLTKFVENHQTMLYLKEKLVDTGFNISKIPNTKRFSLTIEKNEDEMKKNQKVRSISEEFFKELVKGKVRDPFEPDENITKEEGIKIICILNSITYQGDSLVKDFFLNKLKDKYNKNPLIDYNIHKTILFFDYMKKCYQDERKYEEVKKKYNIDLGKIKEIYQNGYQITAEEHFKKLRFELAKLENEENYFFNYMDLRDLLDKYLINLDKKNNKKFKKLFLKFIKSEKIKSIKKFIEEQDKFKKILKDKNKLTMHINFFDLLEFPLKKIRRMEKIVRYLHLLKRKRIPFGLKDSRIKQLKSSIENRTNIGSFLGQESRDFITIVSDRLFGENFDYKNKLDNRKFTILEAVEYLWKTNHIFSYYVHYKQYYPNGIPSFMLYRGRGRHFLSDLRNNRNNSTHTSSFTQVTSEYSDHYTRGYFGDFKNIGIYVTNDYVPLSMSSLSQFPAEYEWLLPIGAFVRIVGNIPCVRQIEYNFNIEKLSLKNFPLGLRLGFEQIFKREKNRIQYIYHVNKLLRKQLREAVALPRITILETKNSNQVIKSLNDRKLEEGEAKNKLTF